MRRLAINVYEGKGEIPTASVRVPMMAIAALARFVPETVRQKLAARGIDVDDVVRTATEQTEPGVLMEFEDRQDRVVIEIEEVPMLGKKQKLLQPNQPSDEAS